MGNGNRRYIYSLKDAMFRSCSFVSKLNKQSARLFLFTPIKRAVFKKKQYFRPW